MFGLGVAEHGAAAIINEIKTETPRAVLGNGARAFEFAAFVVLVITGGVGALLFIVFAFKKADDMIKETPSTIPPTLLALLSTFLVGVAGKVTEEWSGAASWVVGVLPPVCTFFGTQVYSVWAGEEGGGRRVARVIAWVLIAAPLVILGVGAATSDYVGKFLGLDGIDQWLIGGGIAAYVLAVAAAIIAMRKERRRQTLGQ
jgi:hypothetical protein